MNHNTKDSEPSTSPSLLRRACAGDADGWRKLAQVYGPVVYAWARRSGCQSADAADVMQETFSAVAKSLQNFDHQRSGATFRGWLWTITRNKLRDRARSGEAKAIGGTDAQFQMHQIADQNGQQEMTARGLDCDEPPSQIESDVASVRRRAIELLRENFDPRSWRMFWETAVEGREPAAVADEMGVSRWAVYKARARVLQRLQQEMQGLE